LVYTADISEEDALHEEYLKRSDVHGQKVQASVEANGGH
jgi:hypothetical protein